MSSAVCWESRNPSVAAGLKDVVDEAFSRGCANCGSAIECDGTWSGFTVGQVLVARGPGDRPVEARLRVVAVCLDCGADVHDAMGGGKRDNRPLGAGGGNE